MRVLEPLGQIIVRTHRHQVDQAEQFAAHLAVFPQQLGAIAKAAPVAAGRVGRRLQQQLADDIGAVGQIFVELGVDRGVLRGKPREMLAWDFATLSLNTM